MRLAIEILILGLLLAVVPSYMFGSPVLVVAVAFAVSAVVVIISTWLARILDGLDRRSTDVATFSKPRIIPTRSGHLKPLRRSNNRRERRSRAAKSKPQWTTRGLVLPGYWKVAVSFLVGCASAFTFYFTVFQPIADKEVLPEINPGLLVGLSLELITDRHTLCFLVPPEATESFLGGKEEVILDEAPFVLRVDNKSGHVVTVDEVQIVFDGYSVGSLVELLESFGSADLESLGWRGRTEYTGGAEEEYRLYSVSAPSSLTGIRSILRSFHTDEDGKDVSKHRMLFHRIPPYQSEYIGVALTSGHSAMASVVSIEVDGVMNGKEFSKTLSFPYVYASRLWSAKELCSK